MVSHSPTNYSEMSEFFDIFGGSNFILGTNSFHLTLIVSRRGVVVLLRASERKVWSLKLFQNTAGIRQKGHTEFNVRRCSNKKSGSKASVQW